VKKTYRSPAWNRRALAGLVAVALLALVLSLPEGSAGSATNVGKHDYKVNIIGRPNTWSGSDTGSNSPTLFIGIKVQAQTVQCETSSGVTLIGQDVDAATVLPGERIYFSQGDRFAVTDRDATDGSAAVTIPYKAGGYDIFLRILGGSNKNFAGCLDANAYQVVNATTDYLIGHLDANRQAGQPQKVSVKDLFYDPTGTSYFSGVWSDYFWNIQNNGLRNMQLIFYG